MCGALRRAGWWAEDLRCVGDRWLRRHLAQEQQAGKLRGPIIFVGHSCGGRYALYSAQQLAPLGITIDLLVCVDVAWPFPVAANVQNAVHLYRSRWRLYPARPLVPAPEAKGQIENIDLDAQDSPIQAWGMVHMNITTYRSVQDWILARMGQLSRPATRAAFPPAA
jgi:thioesterase domain-containing protein